MTRFKNISAFENNLKKGLSKHSTPAPPDVWSSVAASTAQSAGLLSQATGLLNSTSSLVKVVLLSGTLATIGLMVYTINNTQTTKQNNTAQLYTEPTVKPDKLNQIPANTEKTALPQMENTNSLAREKPTNTSSNATTHTTHTPQNRQPPKSPAELSAATNTITALPSNVPHTDEIIPKNIQSHFAISNSLPCKGERIVLSQNTPTDWLVNGSIVAQNTTNYTLIADKEGILTLSNGSQSKTIRVNTLAAHITATLQENGTYRCSLGTDLIGNWYLANKLIATNASFVDLPLLQVGTHRIEATVVNHTCNTTIHKNISIEPIGSIAFYEIFTPNGDGKNDEYGVDIAHYQNFSIQIYDRENSRVFLSQSPDYKWNGKINNAGQDCPAGEYYAKMSYQLKGESPQVKSIKITLIR